MNSPLYNTIGANYNTTRNADPHIASRLNYYLSPETDGHYLDIGCGTGNYTLALSAMGAKMTGVDPSETMLQYARQRSDSVTWLNGSAENLPAFPYKFDGITGVLTIHHWPHLRNAFIGLGSVLKLTGKIVLFTSTPEQMQGYWLNHYFPQIMQRSIVQMPTLEAITEAAAGAGFSLTATEPYAIRDGLCDHFLYTGKNNPGRYFDVVIRNGISSFAALANKTEVENGLTMLRADLDTGHFESVKSGYSSANGDYLFVVLTKQG